MRRILYIAIAILGVAGVTTAAVVSGSSSTPQKNSSCSAVHAKKTEGTPAVNASATEKAENREDCRSGCFFRALFD